jgi:putative ATP-dependent endonuclease of OLD family
VAGHFGYNEPLVRTLFKDGPVQSAPEYFGHGIQRAYILALLPLVARFSKQGEQQQKLVLAIEEPELYQHPPQARFLASALERLSSTGTQVIVATHSPFFVSARKFDEIRKVAKVKDSSKVHSWSIDEHRKRYSNILGKPAIGDAASQSSMDRILQPSINELFFCRKAIFVEGIEDPAIVGTHLRLTSKYDDFLRSGCHFIIAGGKGNFPTLLTMAQGFSIPAFLIFDFDMDKAKGDRQNDNLRRFLSPLGYELPETLEKDLHTKDFSCWKDNIQNSIGMDFADWKKSCEEIAVEWGWSYSRMDKDPMLLEEALCRAAKKVGKFPALDSLLASLEKFWKS